MDLKWTNAGKVLALKVDQKLLGLNYASASSPSNVEEGQAWYDNANDVIGWYNGTDFFSNIKTNEIVTNSTPLKAALRGYVALNKGCIRYKDADEIYIPSNMIECDGKLCYWTSEITFQLGSGGSNGSSDDLTASDWFYVAIDHSSVTSGTALTASNFINYDKDTDYPVWSDAKQGYYMNTNSSDKCIGACLTDGSSNLLEFHWLKTSGDYFFTSEISELAGGVETSYADVDLTSSVPNFGKMSVLINVHGSWAGDVPITYTRENGLSTTGTKTWGSVKSAAAYFETTDTSQVIEVKAVNSGMDQILIQTLGFRLKM